MQENRISGNRLEPRALSILSKVFDQAAYEVVTVQEKTVATASTKSIGLIRYHLSLQNGRSSAEPLLLLARQTHVLYEAQRTYSSGARPREWPLIHEIYNLNLQAKFFITKA